MSRLFLAPILAVSALLAPALPAAAQQAPAPASVPETETGLPPVAESLPGWARPEAAFPESFSRLPAPAASGLAPTARPVAQQPPPLRLHFSLRTETSDNLDLDPVSRGHTHQVIAGLSFGLLRESGIDRLNLSGGTELRKLAGPGARGRSGLDNSHLNLGWRRATPASSLDLGLNWRRTSVQYLRGLGEFFDPDTGEFIPPEDFDDLTGTGTRQQYGATARIGWREDRPLSFALDASTSWRRYSGTTSASLVDSRRHGIGLSSRARISPVLLASAGLRFSRFQETGAAPRETTSLDLDLIRLLPAGRIGASFSADRTEDGTRLQVSGLRGFDLPRGSLLLGFGVGRPADHSGAVVTGALAWVHELPRGRIAARLARDLRAGSDDTDRLVTGLTVAYSQTLTGHDSLGISLSHLHSEATATGTSSRFTAIGVDYGRALTPDWGLMVGYQHRLRDSSLGPKADANSLYLSLHRSFP